METTLHRELKHCYAGSDGATEVVLKGFRIDVIRANELIEIQHGSLSAIQRKVGTLLKDHTVRVVKPIVLRKRLIKLKRRSGPVVSRRLSPKRGTLLDLFHDFVYFTRVFPHPNLTLEVATVEIEELRYPSRGSRARRDFSVEDQRLIDILDRVSFSHPIDLLRLLPANLAEPFDTQALAERLDIPRWFAQQIAYCCRECGAFVQTGKRGNARVYRRCENGESATVR